MWENPLLQLGRVSVILLGLIVVHTHHQKGSRVNLTKPYIVSLLIQELSPLLPYPTPPFPLPIRYALPVSPIYRYIPPLLSTILTQSPSRLQTFIGQALSKCSINCLNQLQQLVWSLLFQGFIPMAEKQPHLNGAFYGPAIPPSEHSHRPGRRSRSGCCCCLTLFLKIIISIIVIIGIAIFIFWLVVLPRRVKFHLSDIRLKEFNYTNTNSMYPYDLTRNTSNSMQRYDLAVNITIRNPNRRIKIYYDAIEARAVYNNKIVGSKFMPKFLQGHRSTNVLNAHYKGNRTTIMSPPDVEFYDKEKANGVYSFDLDLYMRVRLRFGDIVTGSFKPVVKCDFKVNSGDGRLVGGDETVKCKIASLI
ncbi:protein YLS9-like [Tripterygium wilfordii]|uniref:Protein YLS9-like n=1 Tax=Tripterygium wilfordii TaxID=458696 RepID=A0A7J7CTJ6_TRIWF|nr:NDR1/HIN1-like protein 10 [Tripterygium wilfordii]KAF5737413.1 protein YLS9-like [Tripterygium wilfordii]